MKRGDKEKGELGLTGAGVEIPRIKALDDAISEYEPARDKRVRASQSELAAKNKLVELLHKHADKLPRDPETGAILYRNGESKVTLMPSKEKLKVRPVDEEDIDEGE